MNIDIDAVSKAVDAVKVWGGYVVAGLFAFDKWRGSHAKTSLAVREDVDDARAIDRRSAELEVALGKVIKVELLLEAERLKNARVEADLLKLTAIRENQNEIVDQLRAEANRWKRLARNAPAAAIAAEFARTDMAVDEITKPRRNS